MSTYPDVPPPKYEATATRYPGPDPPPGVAYPPQPPMAGFAPSQPATAGYPPPPPPGYVAPQGHSTGEIHAHAFLAVSL